MFRTMARKERGDVHYYVFEAESVKEFEKTGTMPNIFDALFSTLSLPEARGVEKFLNAHPDILHSESFA